MSLVQAGSPSARKPEDRQVEILQKALQHFQGKLSDSERVELNKEDIIPDANAAIAFTAELDRNPARKGASIASRLHNVLQSVWEFTSVVDTFVSSNPEIAALVWGSVKFTMKLVMNYTSHFEQLSLLFMRLTSSCPRFAEYQALFPNSKQLQKALCEFYASIVATCEHMIQYIQRPGMQLVLNLLRSFEDEFKSDEETIKQRGREVRIEVDYAKIKSDEDEKQLQQRERETQSRMRWLQKRSMKQTESNLDAIKHHQRNRDVERSKKSKRTLIDDLTSYNYTVPYKDASKRRHCGTAEWIFKAPEFLQWTDAPTSCVLFCTGKIGSGKTILAASVVARQLALRKSEEDSFAFFFVRHDSPESRKADVIVRSIVKQCMRHDRLTEKLSKHLEQLHSDPCPSLESIMSLLQDQQLSAHPGSLMILIDGLNELEASERRCLLNLLKTLQTRISYLKIFLCGQESLSAELLQFFQTFIPLSMRNPEAESDIALFVHASLHERYQQGDLAVSDIRLLQDIVDVLIGHADGMFLWVTYLMDDICTHQKDKDIRKALRNLPKSLEETFDRALHRIVAKQKTELACSIFQWVAVAQRSLTLDELREAVSLEIGQDYLSGEDLVNEIQNVASWCENLVQVDEELNFIRFAHFSIHNYITNKRAATTLSCFHFDLDKSDHYAGEICVTYLNLSNFTTTIAKQPRRNFFPNPIDIAWEIDTQRMTFRLAVGRTMGKYLFPRSYQHIADRTFPNLGENKRDVVFTSLEGYPFLEYAKQHWMSHTSNFTRDKSKTWKLWRDTIVTGDTPAQMPWCNNPGQEQSRPEWAYDKCHYALMTLCLANAELSGDNLRDWVVQDAIQQESRLSACRIPEELRLRSGNTQDALAWATFSGNLDIVDSLLRAGADIDGCSSQLECTPLSLAAATGSFELIEHLLALGAAVSAHKDMALCAASITGLINIKRRLGNAGVSDNEPFGFGQNPKDTDVSLKERLSSDPLGRESLTFAFEKLHLKIIKRLLAAGANINSGKDTVDGAVLARAAEAGQLDTVDYLLLKGADINAGQDTPYGSTALYRASESGQRQVVERLLEDAFVSINALSKYHRTAVWVASRAGQFEIVDTLIEAGAYINGMGEPDILFTSSPLCVASERGHLEVVDRLLEAGATPDADKHKWKEKPLCKASQGGHLRVVERLLVAGADVNAGSSASGKKALHFAAQNGHNETCQLLLESGADINAYDILYHTALHDAAEHGHYEVCQRLLAAGANINAHDAQYNTVLHLSARNGHKEVCQTLLEAGASVQAGGTRGKTALHFAAEYGHYEVCQCFLTAGANVNAYDTQYNTALHLTAENGHKDIAQLFLEAGADINARGLASYTALHFAAGSGHIELYRFLLDAGADPTAKNILRKTPYQIFQKVGPP